MRRLTWGSAERAVIARQRVGDALWLEARMWRSIDLCGGEHRMIGLSKEQGDATGIPVCQGGVGRLSAETVSHQGAPTILPGPPGARSPKSVKVFNRERLNRASQRKFKSILQQPADSAFGQDSRGRHFKQPVFSSAE